MEQFQGSAKMKKNAKQIVHESGATTQKSKKRQGLIIGAVVVVILGAIGIGSFSSAPSPLINRLVNYLYFTAYTNKIRFTEYQEELIRNLSEIGRTAGIKWKSVSNGESDAMVSAWLPKTHGSQYAQYKDQVEDLGDIKVFIVCRGNRNGRKK
ncbi:hypothetical protein EfmJHP10_25510 [Enterococcus faecium]|nr:hypothetical protein EfmJHP10_25510 [Enterococcus faecium]